MISLPFAATLVATISLAYAHNSFVRIAHNGVWQPPLKYIRNNTAPYDEPGSFMNPMQWAYPTYPTFSPESVRCGRDNLAWANATETLQVKPGDTIEWLILSPGLPPNTWDNSSLIQWDNCPGGKGACKGSKYDGEPSTVVHQGPVMMHLSRVPAGQEVQSYDGSGEWVKIYTLGVEIRDNHTFWLPNNNYGQAPRFVATIPKQTPAGRYLVRVDQVWYGATRDKALPQLFPACAHVEVVGKTTGDLPKGIKIPEALQMDQPGMAISPNMFADWPASYTYPGGPLWDGEDLVQDHGPSCPEPNMC